MPSSRKKLADALDSRAKNISPPGAGALWDSMINGAPGRTPGTPVPETGVVPDAPVAPHATPARKPSEPLRETPVAPQTAPAPQIGVRIASHYTRVPIAFLDELCGALDIYAQAVYLQLLRLSWGNERDTCKIGYPRLAERANISETA